MGEQPGSFALPRQRTLFGHPPGLYVLFLTQMWERFSYFGMLALLILYLNQYFKLSQDSASNVFKWYTSAIFFSPLIGGYLADRYLGNKKSVVLGAFLMAIGHFLLAVPTLSVLYAALTFLVVGFGFLTPPMITQVGLLYPPGDARRDSAYTIFYMGINLGALISPLACGWLLENTRGGFHSALTLPGIGMTIALVTYVIGQRWVVELNQNAPPLEPQPTTTTSLAAAAPGSEEQVTATPPPAPLPLSVVSGSEAPPSGIEQVPSALPRLNHSAPALLVGLGILLTLSTPILYLGGFLSLDNSLGVATAAVCAFLFAWVAATVRQGLRDRVLAILVLFVFSVIYWAGAGQYGNAINLWADQNTDRYLTKEAPPPDIYPEEAEAAEGAAEDVGDAALWQRWLNMFRLREKRTVATATAESWWLKSLNPVPTPWFQSVNPLMILVLAPLFAMLWIYLGRRGLDPPIPVKMGLGVVFMALAFAVLLGGAVDEDRSSSVTVKDLPSAFSVNARGQVCTQPPQSGPPVPANAGRLHYDANTKTLRVDGVLSNLTRDEIVRETVPAALAKQLDDLVELTANAAKEWKDPNVQMKLDPAPMGFDIQYAGLGPATPLGPPQGLYTIRYDRDSQTLWVWRILEEKDIKGLKVSCGDPEFRAALDELMIKAGANRVSPWWLIAFFLLATMGELCLTPVGMSMVSQLAPPRFATMLMGLWLLTFAFANFLAGALGEQWSTTWAPVKFFTILLALQGGAALVLFLLVRKVAALMHEGSGQ